MMRILHLSDLHYLGDDRMKSGIKLSESLDAVAGYLARPEYTADVMVISGDLIDRDSSAEYSEIVDTLEQFAATQQLPLLMTLGNHDKDEKNDGLVPEYVNFTANGYRFIGFENITPEISDDIADLLAEDLAEDSENGTVLVFHHSPIESPVPSLKNRGMLKRNVLAKLVASSDVKLMLTGHYHHAQYGMFHNIPVWTSPALANHTKMNPHAGTATALVHSGFSYVVLNTQQAENRDDTTDDHNSAEAVFGPDTAVTAIPIWLNSYPVAFTKTL